MSALDHTDYRTFLEAKVRLAPRHGFDVAREVFHPWLKPHQRAVCQWAVAGGRRAIFARFGLGKTAIQLETARVMRERAGGLALISLPLNVRQEFHNDAAQLGIRTKFIRRIDEVEDEATIYLTNHETVRDGKLDPARFAVASIDEASILRGFGGTKTFREFMRLFEPVPHRFVATATPSPNEYIELLAYAAFLDVMDVGQAKTRFFRRNSEKADELTLHPHKEREFWLWVSSWALFLSKPSDLGDEFSDEGYDLPPLDVRWHEVASDHSAAGHDKSGQGRLFRNAAIGVSDAAREKRDNLPARIDKMLTLRAEDPFAHRILWHDLEAERHAIERACPGVVSVYGAQDLEAREEVIADFSYGRLAELAAKPVIAGSGCNFQRHCAWAIFLGIGFKFNDFIQSIHRLYRFLQTKPVRIDLIYSEAERDVRRVLEAKWARHRELEDQMTGIIREYGLSQAAMAQVLTRAIGVERIEVKGENYRLINNDCVDEATNLQTHSVDLILTSIPFSTQYEYTPLYNDFGHTDDDRHFWAQMDFLTPQLLRVLAPGRIAAIHVKDRIVPGGLSGLGFQTVSAFHAAAINHFTTHGFAFLGMKTIATDVVRENNQTYRLGWTEQCKDGSRMGCGMSEYLLIFRKPPSDLSNGYADAPVKKAKKLHTEDGWDKPGGYSRARWQLDAHGFVRSSGDRLLKPEELEGLPADAVYKIWREFSLNNVYDFEHHVLIGESLEAKGSLPPTFMLLPPHARHPEVWTDVARMLTLNGQQAAKGKEMHLCPLQFDIVDRAIVQYTMEGETVFDPFGGLMTVPYRALKLRRRAIAAELNPGYFLDGAAYVEAMAREMAVPGLFDFLDAEASVQKAEGCLQGQKAEGRLQGQKAEGRLQGQKAEGRLQRDGAAA